MVKEFLLVDGYNIIHAWKQLKDIAQDSLENARDRLLEIMADYQGYKNIEVIIVFDAHQVKGSKGSLFKYNEHVDVIYTKEAETADQYIEKTTHQIGRQYRVRVATSDAMEQIIILGSGATRISARELEKEVKLVRKKGKKYHRQNQGVKSNPLESWMRPEVMEWMEELRRKK